MQRGAGRAESRGACKTEYKGGEYVRQAVQRFKMWTNALLKVRTEMVPSEDAQARMAPSSCGSHDTEFTGKLQTVGFR